MANVASLNVLIRADSRRLRADMRRARRDIQRSVGQINQSLSTIGRVGAAGIGLLTAAFVSATRASLNLADNLAKQSRNIAVSVEQYQLLALEAELFGTSIEALGKGFQTLARFTNEASAHELQTYIRAFEQVGVSADALASATPAEQFLLLVDALRDTDSETVKLAVAQTLLGRAGKQLGTIMDANSATFGEASQVLSRVGAVITTDVANAAEVLNDRMTIVSTVIKNTFTQSVVEAVTALDQFSNNSFEGFLQRVANATRAFVQAMIRLGRALYDNRELIFDVVKLMVAYQAVLIATNVLAFTGLIVKLTLAVAGLAKAFITLIFITGGIKALIAGLIITVGALVTAFITVASGVRNSFGQIQASVLALQLTIARVLEGSIASLRQGFAEFVIAFSPLIDGIINGVVGGINKLIDTINLVIATFNRFADTSVALIERVDSQGRLVLDYGVSLLTSSTEAVATATANAAKANDLFAEASERAGDEFAQGFIAPINYVMDAAGSVFGFIESGIEKATDFSALTVDDLVDRFQRLGDTELNLSAQTELDIPGLLEGLDSLDASVNTLDEVSGSIGLEGLDLDIDTRTSFQRDVDGFLENLDDQLTDAITTGNFAQVGLALVQELNKIFIQNLVRSGLSSLFSFFGFTPPSFHTGGIVQGSGDVPVIAKAGELILTESQQGNIANKLQNQNLTVNLEVVGDVTDATRRAVNDMGYDIARLINAENELRGATV